jgi:hypothetical protein
MATDESGEAKGMKTKGLAAVSQAVVIQIVASVRGLYDRSAPWGMLGECAIKRRLFYAALHSRRSSTARATPASLTRSPARERALCLTHVVVSFA